MERGLLWLPLLVLFFTLAWSGWNEYQKVEAYRVWAKQFERSKYDIYAVLGQNAYSLTWGKPTRGQPVDVLTFSLEDVSAIRLLVNNQVVDLPSPPSKGSPVIEFILSDGSESIKIPFTEIHLAVEWTNFLQQKLN